MDADYDCFLKDGIMCVVDKDTEGFASVTNAANEVVRQLIKNGWKFERLIYRDSTGIWDELVVKDGEFAGFAPIAERDLENAIAAVKNTKIRHAREIG